MRKARIVSVVVVLTAIAASTLYLMDGPNKWEVVRVVIIWAAATFIALSIEQRRSKNHN